MLAKLRYSAVLPPSTAAQLAHALRSPRTVSLIALLLLSPFAYIAWKRTQHEPSADDLERDRRDFLAEIGRITDGNILETQWTDDPALDTPHTLIYQYRVSGVTYECAQDVSPLPEALRHIRIDLPIQVRFDPRNPADSIVVAEAWSGLRPDLHDLSPAPQNTTNQPSS